MRGYVSVDKSGQGQIPVDTRTEIYRDPGESERILAETDNQTIPLGVADVTVSRKKGDQAPVVIRPQSEFIEIRNNGNSNGVTVVSDGTTNDVAEGRVETVTRDAKISIGYQTELQLTIEREAKVEQNVVNKGEGDVIMGDNIDRSTSVGDDNVINRSDIGGQGSATVGDDNVVNRSDVGGPDRAEQPSSRRAAADGQGGASAAESESATQFCISCGTEIPTQVRYCPSCGHELEATGSSTDQQHTSDTQKFCEQHQRTYAGEHCPDCAGAGSPR